MDSDFFNYIWLIFLLFIFIPIIQQRLLVRERKKSLKKLEAQLESRVIVLIHRQELFALFGLPLFKFITMEDSEQVLRAIHKTDPNTPIDLIVHTPGGLVLAATQIARALKKHPGKVRVIIPHYAMSGGTLIALAADEIMMNENAVMGPVDPQIGGLPAASILRALERKPLSKVDDRNLILADVSTMAISQLEKSVLSLCEGRLETEKAIELSKKLTVSSPSLLILSLE